MEIKPYITRDFIDTYTEKDSAQSPNLLLIPFVTTEHFCYEKKERLIEFIFRFKAVLLTELQVKKKCNKNTCMWFWCQSVTAMTLKSLLRNV